MVREMLKEIRYDSRFNVMDYNSVDHLLSAIAEIEQRAEKWKEVAVAIFRFSDASVKQLSSEDEDIELEYKADLAWKLVVEATAALGDEWKEAVR